MPLRLDLLLLLPPMLLVSAMMSTVPAPQAPSTPAPLAVHEAAPCADDQVIPDPDCPLHDFARGRSQRLRRGARRWGQRAARQKAHDEAEGLRGAQPARRLPRHPERHR